MMTSHSRYTGRPWRARFLRAPKVALAFTTRADFVPLGDLATIGLGLKTGADAYFFVEAVGSERRPMRRRFGPTGPAGTVRVRGLEDWEGELSTRDVLPAIRNPHELTARTGAMGRSFAVPNNQRVFYLYPRDRRPDADLADYIAVGQRLDIHERPLVRSNASEGRWYRQRRTIARPRWILPYNSAYDYGAWDNAAGLVINGRLVGVDALAEVDVDLLGAVLNSTWVIAARLLEGVATGSEGALDVGPPAARLMLVPDVRRMGGPAVSRVREALATMRQSNVMPSAPTRHAAVDPVRHALDIAILESLGYAPGQASVDVGYLYEGYARWRAAVEDVEARVRVNRTAARRAGQGRGVAPVQLAAQRVWEELSGDISLYPHDHLEPTDSVEEVALPRQRHFPISRPLFDEGVVVTGSNQSIDLGSWARVRYAAMLEAIGFTSPFLILRDMMRAALIANAFEADRGRFLELARERAAASVSSASVEDVAERARKLWFRACRARGMQPPRSNASREPVASEPLTGSAFDVSSSLPP